MKNNRWSKFVDGKSEEVVRPEAPFVASPLALSQPGWQAEVYRQAYEQAARSLRPPLIEQVTARSAN